MILLQPMWSLLAVPAGLALLLFKFPSRSLNILRTVTTALLVLALCRPALRLPDRQGTVVVVADRSDSMPPGSLPRQEEAVQIVQSAMQGSDRLAVVSFGRRSVVEQSPQIAKFTGFVQDTGRDQSNLADALDLALSLIGDGRGGRILILSDGRWTGADPDRVAIRAAGRGLALDYRLQQRPAAGDLALDRVVAPESVAPGESYMITAWIRSPRQQTVTFELKRGAQILSAGERTVRHGMSRLLFRDRVAEAGTYGYTLHVAGELEDPVPENNTGRILVGAAGRRPMLCVTGPGRSGLPALLEAGGLDVRVRPAASCAWTVEELSGYSSVLIENVSANEIGPGGMEVLRAWVQHSAAGLMLTGGRNGFGLGGYFGSPLDPILPVSMELRREHRKFAVAIAVALDRSGSMAMSAGPGRTKMDLANLGAVQVLDMLSDTDEFGVVAVDSSPHVIVDMGSVASRRGQRGRILGIDSMGGGIFIYEALTAASKMLLQSQAGVRHIILFADAADSEEPGAYADLLEKCRGAQITVSVVGLGTRADCDARLLEDIARRGNGRCFFTAVASEIPRLFAQDTFSVARNALVDEETPVRLTAAYAALAGALPADPPPIGGYNLCYLKPEADLSMVTLDEYKAPVVASWYAGSGRVLCYTGEADGEFTGPIAAWEGVGGVFASLAQWTAGTAGELPGGMLLAQQVRGGVCRIELHLDPERSDEPFSREPSVEALSSIPGSGVTARTVGMRWESADLLSAELPLSGQETLLGTVTVPGVGPVTLPPVCLLYSPEFNSGEPGAGRAALERLAGATGGAERTDLAGIWGSLPSRARWVEISHWLILLAAVAILLEVLQRRTGLLTAGRQRVPVAGPERAEDEDRPRRLARRRLRFAPGIFRRSRKEEPEAETPKPAEAEQREKSTLEAMRQARDRARRRTKG